MKDSLETTYCMIFLGELGSVDKTSGLGPHKFGRIPVVDEYICLDEKEEKNQCFYQVQQVIHTGWSENHVAELYVLKTDNLTN